MTKEIAEMVHATAFQVINKTNVKGYRGEACEMGINTSASLPLTLGLIIGGFVLGAAACILSYDDELAIVVFCWCLPKKKQQQQQTQDTDHSAA